MDDDYVYVAFKSGELQLWNIKDLSWYQSCFDPTASPSPPNVWNGPVSLLLYEGYLIIYDIHGNFWVRTSVRYQMGNVSNGRVGMVHSRRFTADQLSSS